MKIDLTNKTAVVTGATGELGRTITYSLATGELSLPLMYLPSSGG